MSLEQDRARHDLQVAEAAEKSWRRLDGHNQLPKIILGLRFTDGAIKRMSLNLCRHVLLGRAAMHCSNVFWHWRTRMIRPSRNARTSRKFI
jgi:hypothetical protein